MNGGRKWFPLMDKRDTTPRPDQDGRAVVTLALLAISVPFVWGSSLVLGQIAGLYP